jgi:putative DNA-invertase from lambdoid prophage Rac
MSRRGIPQEAIPKPPPPLPGATPNGPLRFAYFRVSSADQTIDAQRQELGGGPFDREFSDEDTSGTVPMAERPGFAALLAQARDGDTLHVAAVDRLGRDAIDVQATVRRLMLAGVIVNIKGLGPVGRGVGEIIIAVLSQVADLERRRILERANAGRAAARASLAATGRTHRGKESLGRPRAADAETVAAWRLQHDASIRATARQFDLSDATVKRYCALFRPRAA